MSTVDERTDPATDEEEPEVNLAAREGRGEMRWGSLVRECARCRLRTVARSRSLGVRRLG